MNLIIQKNIKYNIQEFFNKVINLDFVDGISLNIGVTKDDKIVIFNLSSGNDELVKSIYSNTYNQLKNLEMVMLDDVLAYLSSTNYKGKVMLNIIPLEHKCITEEETKALMEKIKLFLNNLDSILKGKENLNLFIHSTSRNLITLLKNRGLKIEIGFAVTTTDLNYIDVDYYVFIYEMINLILIKQEIDLKKEVYLYLGTAYEMSSVFDYLRGSKATELAKELYDKLNLIGDYPDIMKKTFLD